MNTPSRNIEKLKYSTFFPNPLLVKHFEHQYGNSVLDKINDHVTQLDRLVKSLPDDCAINSKISTDTYEYEFGSDSVKIHDTLTCDGLTYVFEDGLLVRVEVSGGEADIDLDSYDCFDRVEVVVHRPRTLRFQNNKGVKVKIIFIDLSECHASMYLGTETYEYVKWYWECDVYVDKVNSRIIEWCNFDECDEDIVEEIRNFDDFTNESLSEIDEVVVNKITSLFINTYAHSRVKFLDWIDYFPNLNRLNFKIFKVGNDFSSLEFSSIDKVFVEKASQLSLSKLPKAKHYKIGTFNGRLVVDVELDSLTIKRNKDISLIDFECFPKKFIKVGNHHFKVIDKMATAKSARSVGIVDKDNQEVCLWL